MQTKVWKGGFSVFGWIYDIQKYGRQQLCYFPFQQNIEAFTYGNNKKSFPNGIKNVVERLLCLLHCKLPDIILCSILPPLRRLGWPQNLKRGRERARTSVFSCPAAASRPGRNGGWGSRAYRKARAAWQRRRRQWHCGSQTVDWSSSYKCPLACLLVYRCAHTLCAAEFELRSSATTSNWIRK